MNQLPASSIRKKPKHLWWYIVGGAVLLLVIIVAVFFIPSQHRANKIVNTQLNAAQTLNKNPPAHIKTPFTNCAHRNGGFFTFEFGCESVGEVFYRGQGDAQSAVESLRRIDELLRSKGWEATEIPNSFQNHLPSAAEIEQARDQNNYGPTEVRYFRQSDPYTVVHLAYFDSWMTMGDRSYNRVRKAIPLKGNEYAYGIYVQSESLRAIL